MAILWYYINYVRKEKRSTISLSILGIKQACECKIKVQKEVKQVCPRSQT